MRDFIYNPPRGPLDYLYLDDDLIFVNKPAGLLSVPGKTEPDCLESRIRDRYPESLTIHRLDMATSGVMVFARSRPAQRHIGLQFEKRQTQKRYIARVHGSPRGNSGHINLPLVTDWPNRPLQKICFETGRNAQTDWAVLAREATTSLLELIPRTGRSHQLRVHMLSIGHPILGDEFYGVSSDITGVSRLMLHAETLSLRKPTGGDWLTIKTPAPF